MTVPENLLYPDTTYYWQSAVVDAHNGHLGQSTFRNTGVWSFKTQKVPPTPPEATATPGNTVGQPQTVTTLTPELVVDAVADPDGVPGGPVRYEFKIATGMDGKSGAVATSGLLTAGTDGKVRWTVPPGTLRDGAVYAWIVQPYDGLTKNVWPAWSKKIKVDLRLGASGPSPFDSAGPVSVNLANGNVNLSFASPTVNTLGGPMGMSFTYNSQETANATRGLVGSYFDGRDALGNVPATAAEYTFGGKTPIQVRTDSSVSFNWGDAAPVPGLQADAFMARWAGFVKVPYASTGWKFGVLHDDGVKLSVNGNVVLDKWVSGGTGIEMQTSAMSLDGSPVPLQLDYFDQSGRAYVEMWVDDVNDAEGPKIVPADWFTTQPVTLPAGWGASMPIAGGTSPWVSATIVDSAIVVNDLTGTKHTYTRTSAGGYSPPAGEYGIASIDGTGRVVLIDEDGTVNQFASDGKLESATPAADAGKPAGPLMVRDADGLVTEVVDPVSKNGSVYERKIAFLYQNGAQTACPTLPSPSSPAPVGMLCRISYPIPDLISARPHSCTTTTPGS